MPGAGVKEGWWWWWWGGVKVLSHTHVAPAGRIKMHALYRVLIPPTKRLKFIFSLTVAPISNHF